MLNLPALVAVILCLFFLYYFDYFKGLYAAIFFILLLPENICINISLMLPSFTIQRLILIMMTLFWIFNKKINKRKNIYFNNILILLSVSMLFSLILSPVWLVSVKRYLYFLTEGFLFFLILQTSIVNEKVLDNIIKSVAYSLLIVAILGLIEKFTGFNPTNLFGAKQVYEFESSYNPDLSRDVTATYLHRILFGIACAIGATFFTFLSIIEKQKKLFYNICTLITFGGLYYSLSRGPWLAFIIGISFAVVIVPKTFVYKGIFLFFLVIFIFMLKPGVVETVAEYFESTFDSTTLKGSSFNWRFIIMDLAFNLILKSESVLNFLFGFGQGSHIFNDFGMAVLSTERTVQIRSWDCEFAVYLYEYGVIGFGLYISLYISAIFRGLQHIFHRKPYLREMILALSCIFIFIFMKISVRIYAVQLAYLEFIILAIISFLLSKRMLKYNEAKNNRI